MIDYKDYTKCGVYTIVNTVNDKLYVGSTTRSFRKRWWDHKSLLRNNKHHNIHLQRAWNKYGESAFKFQILDICDKADCLEMEQYWMNILDVYKTGYNRNPRAGNSAGCTRSAETCKRIGETGNYKLANSKWKGSTHTERAKDIIRAKRAKQRIVISDETKKKVGKANTANSIGNTSRKGTGKFGLCEQYKDGVLIKTCGFYEMGGNASKIVRSSRTGVKVNGFTYKVYLK